MFLQSVGSFDISSIPECKGQAPITAELPTYVNTQQIDAQVLAALQAEAENVTRDMAAAAKESSQKDLFDMSKSGLHILFVRRLKHEHADNQILVSPYYFTLLIFWRATFEAEELQYLPFAETLQESFIFFLIAVLNYRGLLALISQLLQCGSIITSCRNIAKMRTVLMSVYDLILSSV